MTPDNLLTTDIPEKFKDAESGEIRVDALLKSYKELEKKLSQGTSINYDAPHSADDYCIDCEHGLFQPDYEINQRLFEKGLTNEQAQEVYNLAAEKMVPMIIELANEFQADREVEKLINHFGGTEKWKEVSRQLLAFGQNNLPPEVLNNLSSSFDGVLALERMMKSEEPGGFKREKSISSSAMNENDLTSMMRDPRYWKTKDPSFVAKVTDGFSKLYGDQN